MDNYNSSFNDCLMDYWHNDFMENDISDMNKLNKSTSEEIVIDGSNSPKSDATIEYDVDDGKRQVDPSIGSDHEIINLDSDDDIPIVDSDIVMVDSIDNLQKYSPPLDKDIETVPILKKRACDLKLPSTLSIAPSLVNEFQPAKISKPPSLSKEQKAQIREEKRLEKERDKKLKASMAAQIKNVKPDEAIKFVTVHIDMGVVNFEKGGLVISALQEAKIKYLVEHLPNPMSFVWKKLKRDTVMNEDGVLVDRDSVHEEPEYLKIVSWSAIVDSVAKGELLHTVQNWNCNRQKKLTLIIVGMQQYWAYRAKCINRNLKACMGTPKKRKDASEFDKHPIVVTEQVEMALAEIQLVTNTSHRHVDSAEELAAMVVQYTKAISQTEYKRGQYSKERDNLSWFAQADNKNCVKVDKNGNGLKELWQRQICQFNSIGLEVAQAIVCKYGSPQALLTAYANCGDASAASDLLADIPVRREAGILSSTRRVGPELSHKIHRFLTSNDPSLPV